MIDESRSLGGLKPVMKSSQINLEINCQTFFAARKSENKKNPDLSAHVDWFIVKGTLSLCDLQI